MNLEDLSLPFLFPTFFCLPFLEPPDNKSNLPAAQRLQTGGNLSLLLYACRSHGSWMKLWKIWIVHLDSSEMTPFNSEGISITGVALVLSLYSLYKTVPTDKKRSLRHERKNPLEASYPSSYTFS